MKKKLSKILVSTASIILIGSLITLLPNDWIAALPNWVKYVAIGCSLAIIILNAIFVLEDLDVFWGKNNK